MSSLTATLLDRIGLLPVETTLLQIVDPRQKGIERGERGILTCKKVEFSDCR
jgi:hypothetical protein